MFMNLSIFGPVATLDTSWEGSDRKLQLPKATELSVATKANRPFHVSFSPFLVHFNCAPKRLTCCFGPLGEELLNRWVSPFWSF